MKEYTVKEMTEYLKMATELEASIDRQTRALVVTHSELRQENERLVKEQRKLHAQNVAALEKRAPKKPVEKQIPLEQPMEAPAAGRPSAGYFPPILFLILSVIFFALSRSFDGSFFVIGGVCVGIALLTFWATRSLNRDNAVYEGELARLKEKQRRLQEEAHQQYLKQVERYEKALPVHQKEVYQEKEQYADKEAELVARYVMATKSLEQIRKPLSETMDLRERLYSTDIIFEKYRNLAAISMFYEYFASGRCTELTGPNGAYNLYESELRQNLIIDKLDDIVTRLDQIQKNQFVLYQEMRKTNTVLNRILNELIEVNDISREIQMTAEGAAVSAQVTALNTETIARNTKTLVYLDALFG